MAYSYVTVSGPQLIMAGKVKKAIVQVNNAITGTLTIADSATAAATPVVGAITNPTLGSKFEFWDIKDGLCVGASTTGAGFTVSYR